MSRKWHKRKSVLGKTYWYNLLVWANNHCESNMENQDLQAEKSDHRIPILQLARFKSKKQNEKETKIWIKKIVLNHELGSRLIYSRSTFRVAIT